MEIIDTQQLKTELKEQLKPQNNDMMQIQKQAVENTEKIMKLDITAFKEKSDAIKTINKFGLDSLQTCAKKNSLLQNRIGNLSKSGTEGGMVLNSLSDLQREIKDLDPSFLDFTKQGFLGKLFNPVRRYFHRYKKADTVIEDIIKSLDLGRDTLQNDNVTLDIEQEELRQITTRLNKELELGEAVDKEITSRLNSPDALNESEEKIKFLTDNILFPLRQRIMDMQQMVVINQQGIVAMEVVKRNNLELIRGVDRAKTVTITALKTAVMVASALYNQKVTLRKIELLNETTANMISATSKMLKEQGCAIQKQASQVIISPQVLKDAFQNCIQAIEEISTFKRQALPQMQQNINTFKELASIGEKEISKIENMKE